MRALRTVQRSKGAVIGLVILGGLTLLAVVAPLLPLADPIQIDSPRALYSPGTPYLFPGLAIMLAVLALNLLGDGLRDALDPRLKV